MPQQNAQEWLDKEYPIDSEKRRNETKLEISKKSLWESLSLEWFTNLEELWCDKNKIVKLDLTSCLKIRKVGCSNNEIDFLSFPINSKITYLSCGNNNLADLSFLNCLSPKNLIHLSIENNNIPRTDIAIFSRFVNLEWLWIGTSKASKVKKGICNLFYGNLKSLESLTKLKSLNISSTDIDEGLEYLPDSLEEIFCYSSREDAKVMKIYRKIIPFISNIKRWREAGKPLSKEEELEKQLKEINNSQTQSIQQTYFLTSLQTQLVEKDQHIHNLYNELTAKNNFISQLQEELQEEKNKVTKWTNLHSENLQTIERTGERFKSRKQLFKEQLILKEREILNLQEQITNKERELVAAHSFSNQVLITNLKDEINKLKIVLTNKEREIIELKKQTVSYQELINAITEKKAQLASWKITARSGNDEDINKLLEVKDQLTLLEKKLQELKEEQTKQLTVNINQGHAFINTSVGNDSNLAYQSQIEINNAMQVD